MKGAILTSASCGKHIAVSGAPNLLVYELGAYTTPVQYMVDIFVWVADGYKEVIKKVSSSADPLLPVLRNSGLQSLGPLQLLPKDMLKFFMKQHQRAWLEQGQQRLAENSNSSESLLEGNFFCYTKIDDLSCEYKF